MEQSARNILITGLPGTGKTTLIKRVYDELEDLSPVGFLTEEIRTGGVRQGFSLVPAGTASCQKATLSHVDFTGMPRVGKYGVDIAGFEEFLETLAPALDSSRLVIIDEVGKMECLSGKFSDFIRQLLDSEQLLLATIALKGGGLISEIKRRNDVTLLEITKRNRDSKVGEICQLLRQSPSL